MMKDGEDMGDWRGKGMDSEEGKGWLGWMEEGGRKGWREFGGLRDDGDW